MDWMEHTMVYPTHSVAFQHSGATTIPARHLKLQPSGSFSTLLVLISSAHIEKEFISMLYNIFFFKKKS